MTERPIIFSKPMVQAILAGRKSQTRRVVNPQPQKLNAAEFNWKNGLCAMNWLEKQSPYGVAGDTLWVRETWADDAEAVYDSGKRGTYYRADPDAEKIRESNVSAGIPHAWRPSIHMPRWRARIFLRVNDVRVERLHTITEADARAEGWELSTKQPPVEWYRGLWDDINAARGYRWLENPWVWVVAFERIKS